MAAPIIIPIPPRITGRSSGPPMTGVEAVWFLGSAFLEALVMLWVMFTVFAWLMPMGDTPRTLPQVLAGQWRWLKTLLLTGKVPS